MNDKTLHNLLFRIRRPHFPILRLSCTAALVLVLSACVASPQVVETQPDAVTPVAAPGEVDEAFEPAATDEAVAETDTATGETPATGLRAVGVANAPDQYVRASGLTDYDFENVNDEDIGDIEDLLVDLNDGTILFLSVEYGGFLDLGDREIFLPLSAFVIGPEGGLVLAMAEEQLRTYPEIDAAWLNLDDPDWGMELDRYWTGVNVALPDLTDRDTSNTAWVSDMMGLPFYGWGGLTAGVTDLLVNLQSGTADYALIDQTTAGAVGDIYIVPIQALTYDPVTEQVVFEEEIGDDVLINAPLLDPTVYPLGEPIDGNIREAVNQAWRDMGFDWWDGT